MTRRKLDELFRCDDIRWPFTPDDQWWDLKRTTSTGLNLPYDHYIETFAEKDYVDIEHIVIAAAGYSKNDIEVLVEPLTHDLSYFGNASTEKLTIKTIDDYRAGNSTTGRKYIHSGLAQRAFKMVFNLTSGSVVRDVTFKDGLLHISIALENKKPTEAKKIKIS